MRPDPRPGFPSALAALAVAACVVSVLYPWGSGSAPVWETWFRALDRPVRDIVAPDVLPFFTVLLGFLLVLGGVGGNRSRVRFGALALLATALLHYTSLVMSAGISARLGLGLWLVVAAALLAFVAAQAAPARA